MTIGNDDTLETLEGEEILPETEAPAEAEDLPELSEAPEEGRRRERKRRLASGAVALVTSASVLVGGIFNSPALLPDEENILPQVAYTQNDSDDLDGSGDDGSDEDSTEESGEHADAAAGAEVESPPEVWDDHRRRLQRLPLAVKLLAIPLAALLCWLVFSGASALLGSLVGGILAQVLAWALLIAALLVGFTAAVKTIFPDLPLKKILNKRSLSGILIGGLALAAADIVLPMFWVEYTRVEAIVRALGILAVIGTAAGSFTVRENRRRRKEAEAAEAAAAQAEEGPEEEETEKPITREDILAMADSVSRKR